MAVRHRAHYFVPALEGVLALLVELQQRDRALVARMVVTAQVYRFVGRMLADWAFVDQGMTHDIVIVIGVMAVVAGVMRMRMKMRMGVQAVAVVAVLHRCAVYARLVRLGLA